MFALGDKKNSAFIVLLHSETKKVGCAQCFCARGQKRISFILFLRSGTNCAPGRFRERPRAAKINSLAGSGDKKSISFIVFLRSGTKKAGCAQCFCGRGPKKH